MKVRLMDKSLTISYKHFFRKLVEAIPWPMLVIDTDLRILHGNQQAQSLFGLGDSLSLTEQRLDQLLDDAAILQLIEATVPASQAQCGEFNRASSSGTWKVSVKPVEHRKVGRGKRKKGEVVTP